MNSPAKAHEPTMEEILASIRRIISDDEPAPARPDTVTKPALKTEPKPAAVAEPEAEAGLGQDDIDAMFAAFDAAPAAPAPKKPEPEPKKPAPEVKKPEPAPTAEAKPFAIDPTDDLDVFELTEDMADEPAEEPEWPAELNPPAAEAAPKPAPATPAAPPAPQPMAANDRLLSPPADDAVSSAFGSLANTILASNARTLDDIVKEMLRPMLRTWLDDNLPPLVERLVRQEIERVARGGR